MRKITGHFGVGKMDQEAIAQWVDRIYKPDRLNALPGRKERIIEDRMHEVEMTGWTLISRYDSVTGKAEIYQEDIWQQS